MKSIRQFFLAVALSIVGLTASAQTIETTPNLVTNIRAGSGTGVWLGTGGNSQLDGVHPIDLWGCCTSYSGSSPFFDTSQTNGNGQSGQIIWSYGNVAVNHIVAINQALSASGLQINGYNWSYDVRNNNGGSGQAGVDTLTATSRLWNSTYNTVLLQQSRTHNTTMDWTTFSGTVTAATPHPLANVGNLQLEFRGGDSGFWGGYYGPQIRDVRASFNYSVDPCTANPGSSPSCAGYADVVISPNLVPTPNHWTTNGQSINQTYAINQALSISGAGFMIHGFDYGYKYNLGSSYSQCTAHNQDGSCSWTMTFNPRVDVNMSVKNDTGTNIYSVTHTEIATNTGNRSRDFQYRFASSRDALTLGAFGFTASTAGNSTVWDMYSRAVYTPDQCTLNPLGDSTCPGYAAALFAQQCSINTLHDPACPGYAQAYFSYQCSQDALYDSTCPGYATAYYNYQCSADALYHTGCPGYAQAFLTQQCTSDSLYSVQCPGYAQAYLDQQCGLDPLYDSTCPGYADAYYVQQCTASPLYDSGCNGYAQAYFDQQCGLDALYNNQCPGYSEAYAKKYILTAPSTETAVVESETVVVAQATTTETKEVAAVAAVTEPAPTSTVSASPAVAATAPVSLVAAPSPAPAAPAAEKKAEAKTETKTETAAAGGSSESKNKPATTRQALAQRRLEAAREAAAESAKNNPGAVSSQMDSAASMEQQVELQNVVLGAMGFVAGFDAYGRVNLQDAAGYKPFEIYRGQRNVDSAAARGLLGRSDRLHSEMVDGQYK
jgi:hypothetical protein